VIYVHHAEVLRIARHTGLAPTEVADLETEALSSVVPVVRLDGVQGQLVVRRAVAGGPCRFLAETAGRCTIHGEAPYCCQMYPHAIGGKAGADELRQRDDAECPGPYEITAPVAEELARAARRFWGRELPAYERRVWYWNMSRAPGGLEEFLAFCRRKLVIPKGRLVV
jgi:Fe-S-cluster containining protein